MARRTSRDRARQPGVAPTIPPAPNAFNQLAAELRWLRGECPKSFLAPRPKSFWFPPEKWTRIARRVEKILQKPELTKFLGKLAHHNAQHPGDPFLLGPQLFGVFRSLEERSATISRMPVLNRTDAEIRAHLKNASATSKTLAAQLRKGPRPQVAVATPSDDFSTLTPFAPILAAEAVTIEALDVLLDRAAVALDLMARQIPRAKQHRNRSKEPNVVMRYELRSQAASTLVQTFRRRLRKPWHGHVATIVSLMSGLETDTDYVKKTEKHRR